MPLLVADELDCDELDCDELARELATELEADEAEPPLALDKLELAMEELAELAGTRVAELPSPPPQPESIAAVTRVSTRNRLRSQSHHIVVQASFATVRLQ
jgi:hypothetical protein